MNRLDQENIRTMRTAGCSYKQIADCLYMKKSTVKSHCLRNGIRPLMGINSLPKQEYRLCMECRQLFIVHSKHNKQFCSDKCRRKYWRKERDYEAYLEAEYESYQTLQKGLDFLREESDELDGRNKPVQICVKKEVI